MKLIIGLGNPGIKYEQTRHNAGFIIVGNFAEKFNIIGHSESKFKGIVGKGTVNQEEVVILQPTTFMNLSGEAVSAVMNFYKIHIKDILVVYDDLSIDLGRLRFRANGSAGGHNGIKSIISHCSSQEFSRLKIGIGPQPDFMAAESFVLQKFSTEEMQKLQKLTTITNDAIECWIQNNTETASCKYNNTKI